MKLHEKHFFIYIKGFIKNYFYHVENKLKFKLWQYCVSKLLIMRDLELKHGFITLLYLMNFLLLELEEEFIKKEVKIPYLIENFAIPKLSDYYTKMSLWEFFINIAKKSFKLA